MAGCVPPPLAVLGLLTLLAPHAARPTVFLPASDAHELLARWRRAGSYLLEELFEGHLEKECLEEVCVYEEAREVFEDTESTDEFWKTYMGGSPCASQPCLNNGSCQNSIRGYTCTCAPGYEGPNCAFEVNSALDVTEPAPPASLRAQPGAGRTPQVQRAEQGFQLHPTCVPSPSRPPPRRSPLRC
uniref:Uncharacterized protein n=1 Tax=Ovis aries TaxID=9940 RepID=A0AC11ETJ8_SHEEP